MADDYTILNPGAGGDVMDETRVTYPSAPTTRKRPRVVVTGENIDEIIPALNTNPDGTEYGLTTRPIVPNYPGDQVVSFNIATLVPSGIETTVVTYTVPSSKTFYFIGLVASGNTNALFKLYSNSTALLGGRSSVANLTLHINYAFSPIQVAEGDTISIKTTHQAGTTCDFEATILGYLL